MFSIRSIFLCRLWQCCCSLPVANLSIFLAIQINQTHCFFLRCAVYFACDSVFSPEYLLFFILNFLVKTVKFTWIFFCSNNKWFPVFLSSNKKLRWNCGNILEYFRLSIYFTCVSVSLSIQSMFKFIKSNQSTINYIYRRICCCCPFASERNLCFSMKKWWNK